MGLDEARAEIMSQTLRKLRYSQMSPRPRSHLISTVRTAVHTNPSRKKSFSKTIALQTGDFNNATLTML